MLYHMRVPLLGMLILVLLPLVVHLVAGVRQLLGNLFVLSGPTQLATVLVGAFVYANAVLFMVDILWKTGDERFGYENPSFFDGWLYLFDGIPFLADIEFYLYSLLLALPVMVYAVLKTQKGHIAVNEAAGDVAYKPRVSLGVALGIVFIIAISVASEFAFRFLSNTFDVSAISNMLTSDDFLGRCDCWTGYTGDNALLHLRAISFLVVGFGFYLIVGSIYHPKPGLFGRVLQGCMTGVFKMTGRKSFGPHRSPAAALFYVMLLLTTLTLFLGALAYLFDITKIPILLVLVAFSAAMSVLWKTRNIYTVHFRDTYSRTTDSLLCHLLEQRIKWQDEAQFPERTFVIFCLKGGGIHSAGWGIRVLTGLQERLGVDFARSIGLMAGVSGGAVGTMHYVNHLMKHGEAAHEKGHAYNIFKDATADSLDAATWGILYLDFWRMIGFPFLIRKERDRGWAIEQDWKAVMGEKWGDTTYADLYNAVEEGRIPIPVFNATVADDASPLFFSPVEIPLAGPSADAVKKNFISRLKTGDARPLQADVDFTTAGRLSAAFPYVSPISSNDKGDHEIALADGGYFDNYGLFAGVNFIEWLQSSDHAKKTGIKNVLLVSIRAFPTEKEEVGLEKTGSNWMRSLFGPLQIITAARSSTQGEHVEKEVHLLKQVLENATSGNAINLETINIEYPGGVPDPPLSWKLSPMEKKSIHDAWEQSEVQKTVDEIESIWTRWRHGVEAKKEETIA